MDLRAELSKMVVRRRLAGGEFSYVVAGSTITGKKAVLSALKAGTAAYTALRDKTSQEVLETDQEFEARLLKSIPLVKYEDEVKKEKVQPLVEGDEDERMEQDGADTAGAKDVVTAEDMFTKVSISGFPKNATAAACESFLRQFENIVVMKRLTVKDAKTGKEFFQRKYSVTFKDEKSASEFLASSDLKFEGALVPLTKELLRTIVQKSIVRKQQQTTFNVAKMMMSAAIKQGDEDKTVFIGGIKNTNFEGVQQFFCGLESEFDDIRTVKSYYYRLGLSGNKTQKGFILRFGSKKTADIFCEKEIKFEEKALRPIKMYNNVELNRLYRQPLNVLGAESQNENKDQIRRVVLLRADLVKDKFPAIFPGLESVAGPALGDSTAVLTFQTAEAAKQALLVENEAFRPVDLISLQDYLELRKTVLDEFKMRLDSLDKRCEEIRNNHVEVDETSITVTDPKAVEDNKKKPKAETKPIAAKVAPLAATAVKSEKKSVQTDQVLSAVVARRRNRGASEWDECVVVTGLKPKSASLGQPNGMDICNYFIHNHKDVKDVKFLDWTDAVFVKFPNATAAERFLSLDYVMFYGSDVNRNDVETYLKKRSPAQKEEIARLLLNKSFDKIAPPKSALASAGESNGTGKLGVAAAAAKADLELSSFQSRDENIRDLIISELHLSEGDVGQPSWQQGEDSTFSARLPVKLEETALSYLVKRWNELEISVGGQTVSASLASKGVKRDGNTRRKKAKKMKM